MKVDITGLNIAKQSISTPRLIIETLYRKNKISKSQRNKALRYNKFDRKTKGLMLIALKELQKRSNRLNKTNIPFKENRGFVKMIVDGNVRGVIVNTGSFSRLLDLAVFYESDYNLLHKSLEKEVNKQIKEKSSLLI